MVLVVAFPVDFTFAHVRTKQVPVLASERLRGGPGPDKPAHGILLPQRDLGRPQVWRQVMGL